MVMVSLRLTISLKVAVCPFNQKKTIQICCFPEYAVIPKL